MVIHRWMAACVLAMSCCARAVDGAVQVVDDTGRSVRLARPAQRIVTLAPHLAELVFDAGAGARLVGVAAYSDVPAQVRSLPTIGDARGLDLERLVLLRPDLVLAWTSGTPLRQVERLRQLGYAVFSNEPRRLLDIAVTIERLGVLAGTENVANARASAFRRRLAGIEARASHAKSVRVFYQVWAEPLLTVNADHIIADVLRVCGGDNIFDATPVRMVQPSREAVVLADPDAIVVAAAAGAEGRPLDVWRRWKGLRAVRLNHLYALDPSLLHRHTPRILDALDELCTHLASARRE